MEGAGRLRLVADANVLFSALIRDAMTRKLWFDIRLKLYAPSFILDEYTKHAPELSAKSGLGERNTANALSRLLKQLEFIPVEEMRPYRDAAKFLCSDAKDEPYVACALAIGADLWSRDRHLAQPRIRLWNTPQLAERLGYL